MAIIEVGGTGIRDSSRQAISRRLHGWDLGSIIRTVIVTSIISRRSFTMPVRCLHPIRWGGHVVPVSEPVGRQAISRVHTVAELVRYFRANVFSQPNLPVKTMVERFAYPQRVVLRFRTLFARR